MSAETDIWNAIVKANEAWRSGNPAGVAGLFHEDVVMAGPDASTRLHGREAMVRSFQDYTRQVDTLDFRELDHQVDVIGDVAVATYRFKTRFEVNGTVHDETGREILTFARRHGTWAAVWRMQVPVSDREGLPGNG